MPNVLDPSSLINRAVEVTLISQPVGGKYFDTTGNALVITDQRVQFSIKKDLGKTPNGCTITLTNLSKDTRSRLERKPVYAILRAGHNGVLHPLFSGNVHYATSNLKDTDWETKIQIADGGRAYAHAFMARSYAPPISPARVLADVSAAMGLGLPSDIANIAELRQSLAGGLTAHGPARDVLSKVLTPLGYSWSMQDGRLQILKSGIPNAKAAWLIDVDAGMIGSPEGSVPQKPGAPSELSIDVLLYPEIGPGDTIQVQSKSVNGGFFRVSDVTHTGDTAGDAWKTSIKATPLGGSATAGRGKR